MSISSALYDTGIDKEFAMTAVTISPKFQVVIPKVIRENLDLRPGQQVEVIEYDGRVEYVPVRALESMRGFLAGIDTSVPREDDRL